MCAEKSGDDGDGPVERKSPSRAQLLAFVLEREPVAGLDLDRRDAFGEQRIEARQGRAHELPFARSSRGIHR